jgi:hypothetical protein
MADQMLTPEQVWELANKQAAEMTEGTGDDAASTESEFEDISSLYKDPKEETTEEAGAEGSVDGDTSTKTQESSNKKTFKIKDKFGEERDLTVDLTDDSIKSIIQKAKEAEDLEAEKAAFMDEIKSYKEQMAEMKALMQEAKELKSLSPEDLMDKLYAKEGGYSAWLKKQHEEIERGANMTEEELRELQYKKEIQAKDKEVQKLASKMDELVTKLNNKDAESEQRQLDSYVTAATQKYNFNSVFKDNSKKAQKWNERVWADAKSSLEKLQDANIKLTSAIIDREIKRSFMEFKQDLVNESENKSQELISKQKEKAANSAANSFRVNQQNDNVELTVKKLLESGNESGILELAKKYPSKVRDILFKLGRGRR